MGSETRVHVGRIVFGLFIAWVGTLFFFDQMGWINLGAWWRFWPLVLVVLGVVRLLSPGRRNIFAAIMLMALGGAFLLNEFRVSWFHWSYVWPGFVVVAGLAMVLRGLRWGSYSSANDPAAGASTLTGFAILGGLARKVISQDFRGGDATAILGGCDIDLRGASIAPGTVAVLDCFVFWGGLEIKVPPDWSVEITGIPLLGGFADTRRDTPRVLAGVGALGEHLGPLAPTEKRLRVKGLAIMGGVEVKN